MPIFRFHRGSLVDSMKTCVSVRSKKHLTSIIQIDFSPFQIKIEQDQIKIEKYGDGFDNRIGWYTHIVTIEGLGVAGFLSENFNQDE